MGKIPDFMRRIIARNIKACRVTKYPGRGGGKRCAEAFGVLPQQWSPWERGARVPDEERIRKIADFFGVTVEYLQTDHGWADTEGEYHGGLASGDPANGQGRGPAPYPCCPFYNHRQTEQGAGGELRSMCWLAERFFGDLKKHGLSVHLRPADVDMIVEKVRECLR